MSSKILVGADPELFMKNKETGEFVSAHGLIPGTKHEPHKVPFGAVQIDGTALEFNIDPANTVEEFVHHIQAVKAQIADFVPGYNVVAEPTAVYERTYFDWGIPGVSKELGCDPDFCAWNLEVNPRPDPGNRPLRTAAGHIHVGWTSDMDVYDRDHFRLCGKVARQLDYFLGIFSLKWDSDNTRRELYGKAGAFRPKPYGMEYRVLSNKWLTSEPLIRWVYNQTVMGVRLGLDYDEWAEDNWGMLAQQIIDNGINDWFNKYPILPNVEPVPEEQVA